MDNCLFCRIASGSIPSHRVYEDEGALAFLDIHPRSPGHTVVIPKAHYKTLLDVPEAELGPLWIAVKRTAERVKKALGSEGFTIGMNQGETAGQTIPHLHVHIMPRTKDDGGGTMHSIINNPGNSTIEEMVEKFSAEGGSASGGK